MPATIVDNTTPSRKLSELARGQKLLKNMERELEEAKRKLAEKNNKDESSDYKDLPLGRRQLAAMSAIDASSGIAGGILSGMEAGLMLSRDKNGVMGIWKPQNHIALYLITRFAGLLLGA